MEDNVTELHRIAREIADKIGSGNLSDDLRRIADRLHEIIRREKDERKRIETETI